MQHPMLTFIVKYPNHELQMATQKHLKKHVIIKCVKCTSTIVTTRERQQINCKKCSTLNKVKKIGNQCQVQQCDGYMEFVKIGEHIIKKCNSCTASVLISMPI